MFLLIFESIGTQELILIGIVALIFIGPRRMPEMARKLGKIMSDFRNTTNEFRSTWEREVNFEEEEKAFRTDELPAEPVARVDAISSGPDSAALPAIREVDAEELKTILPPKNTVEPQETAEANPDKRDWL